MGHLKTIVEYTWEGEEGNTIKENCYLLHFGLRYDLVAGSDGNIYPVSYTVAIIQNIKSGAIEFCSPDQLKVLGTNVKEQNE